MYVYIHYTLPLYMYNINGTNNTREVDIKYVNLYLIYECGEKYYHLITII